MTHYYLIDFLKKPELVLDSGEVRSSSWERSQDFLDRWRDNDVLIVPPMRFLLESLACGKDEYPRTFDIEDVETKVPLIEPTGE